MQHVYHSAKSTVLLPSNKVYYSVKTTVSAPNKNKVYFNTPNTVVIWSNKMLLGIKTTTLTHTGNVYFGTKATVITTTTRFSLALILLLSYQKSTLILTLNLLFWKMVNLDFSAKNEALTLATVLMLSAKFQFWMRQSILNTRLLGNIFKSYH